MTTTMTAKTITRLFFLLTIAFASAVQAFVVHPATGNINTRGTQPLTAKNAFQEFSTVTPRQSVRKATHLQMGYQLPPSRDPKGPFEQIQAILPSVGFVVLVGLFFASPLGGIFFAITNSLFVLAFLTPFILFAGFQIWSALYTIEAPCPSCGQIPVRALKNGEPTVCLNCGAFSRSNEAGDGLELCNNPYDMMNEGGGSGSLFDSLFGGNGVSNFDAMGSSSDGGRKEEQTKKTRKQGTIIDVEVERD